MKTDPNKDFTIKEFYIKVKGDYGKEKNVKVNKWRQIDYPYN